MSWGASKPRDAEISAVEDVYRAELEEIAHRRRVAHNVGNLSAGEVQDDLVGVALSGGGVRSGAVGLGFIQGLYEKGMLPFVDYLSTVSGGGYAGAYLSSVSLAPQKSRGPEDAQQSASAKQAQARRDREFPIRSEANGKQPQRILDFVFGSRYLKRTWTFTNRYLFGLLLTWVVLLSGLFALCAFSAWSFRWLDSPWFCSWLNAIGITSDFSRSFVPAMVLALCWFLAWVVSYWRKGARSTGAIPRFFCRAMMFSVALGFAGLIGTGDVTLPAVFGEQSVGQAEASNWSSARILVLSAILASLLPYFTFSRLLRSGVNPKNSGEKYVFYIATNALVYGVPFAVFAYFAQENISDWNERRSDLLTQIELRNTDPNHPLWQDLREAASPAASSAASSSGSFWASEPPRRAYFLASRQVNDSQSKLPDDGYTYQSTLNTLLTLQALSAMSNELIQPEDATSAQTRASWQIEADEIPPTPWQYLEEYSRQASPAKDRELSRPHRWMLLAKYWVQRVFESEEEYSQNRISRMARNRRERTEVKWELADAVNRQLADEKLHERLVPRDKLARPKPKETGAFERVASLFSPQSEAPKVDQNPDAKAIANSDTKAIAKAVTNDSELMGGQIDGMMSFKEDAESLLAEYERVSPWLEGATSSLSQEEAQKMFVNWRTDVLRARLYAESVAKRSPKSQPLKNMQDIHSKAASKSEQLANDKFERQVSESFKEAQSLYREDWQRSMIAANRSLMAAYYGLRVVGPKEIVFAANVLYEDQRTRARWFIGAFIVFLLASVLVDLNFTSWHGFYSEQIGKYWIDEVPGLANRLPLAQLETTSFGRPYHLLTGCMNRFGVAGPEDMREPQSPFLFSKLFCGTDLTGYESTSAWMGGEYTLEDAVAVSGAAVSPVRAQNPLIMALLLMFNIRLGQWVDTPGMRTRFRWFVSPIHVIYNLMKKTENRAMRFITDGGHVENLGIEPLLKRRCRLIVAVDAGQDETYAFADLGQLIRRMRLNHGITLETPGNPDEPLSMINMRPKEPNNKNRAKFVTSNVLLAEIRYPEADHEDPSYLIYLKSCLTGREPLELIQVAERSDFPHDPTSDQFLAPEQFDAYRLLGNFLSSTLAGRIPEDIRVELARMRQGDFVDRLVSRRPIRRTLRPLNDNVKSIMEVVNDKSADAFQRRNAARDLMNEDPFPIAVLDDLLTQLRTANDDVADGVADAIVAADYAAINPLVNQLERSKPAVEFREIQRIADVLARIQQNSPEPMNHVGSVIANLLESTAAKIDPQQKPPRVWTRACCQMLELIRAVSDRQLAEDPAHHDLQATVKTIADTTPHEDLRCAAEVTLKSLYP